MIRGSLGSSRRRSVGLSHGVSLRVESWTLVFVSTGTERREGSVFSASWTAGTPRPGRAARPITAIRAAGRAACHPEGRSVAEDARSALTRRPSRSYAPWTSRQAAACSGGGSEMRDADPAGTDGLRMPVPGAGSWPPTRGCRRRSSRHARSPWADRHPPAPTGPVRRPVRATPRSRTRRGIPATRPRHSRYWSCSARSVRTASSHCCGRDRRSAGRRYRTRDSPACRRSR